MSATTVNLLLGAVGILWSALIALLLYIKRLHSKHNDEQVTNIRSLTEEQVKSRQVIENNNRLYDKVFDYLTRTTK